MMQCGHSVKDRVIGVDEMRDPNDDAEWET